MPVQKQSGNLLKAPLIYVWLVSEQLVGNIIFNEFISLLSVS